MGNGLRPRIIRNDGHNPKTRKGNYIVKNRNIQFNATANSSRRSTVAAFLIPLLLVCFAVFFSAATPALADKDLPFEGTVSGAIPTDLGPPVPGSGGCVFDFFVSNSGTASQLGSFTGTSNFVPNVCDGSYTGTFHWIAANGDSMSGPFFGQQIPTGAPGVYLNFETALITGGTGKFKHTTGMFTLYGQVNFVTRTFVLPFKGIISKD
jgi:hypothetical protein